MSRKPTRAYIAPIIRAQINQLHTAKRHSRYERAQYGVITQGHMLVPQKQAEISHRKHDHVTAPIQPTPNSEKAVLGLYASNLKSWSMKLNAALLNGVFFKNPRQAYNALRRLENADILVNDCGLFDRKL